MTGYKYSSLHDDFRKAGGDMTPRAVGAKIAAMNIIFLVTAYTFGRRVGWLDALFVAG